MVSRQQILKCVGVLVVAVFWSGAAATATAANLYAKVSQTGTLISGSGVSSVSWLGPGRYEVTFNTNVTQCAYVATTANAYSQALQVYTASGHLSPNGVYVETKNQGGGLTAGPFNLFVNCGATKLKYAVVGYSSDLVRATAGTILTELGPGRYAVTFLESVSTCAFVATVADPSNGLVFAPSGVYTGSGSNSKTVYIETKNPGGGLQGGIPFHLSVVCSGAPGTRIAVVNSSGLPSRGSSLTSSYKTSPGQYFVVTNANIAHCATVATRGSVNTAVPFAPATVETVPGPAANTTGIQVRNLLFFGGAVNNAAFHAATVCP
jgi:sarcosine oxidase gamma subunit